MAWNIYLQGEEGDVLEKAFIENFFGEKIYHTSQLLRFIDPYGDTVLNQLQMPLFQEEWRQLEDASKKANQHENWKAVMALAVKCNSEVHLYLKVLW